MVAMAEGNTALAQNPANHCEATLVTLDEAPDKTNLLEPVIYQFESTFNEKCQLEVKPAVYDRMICNSPTVALIPSGHSGKLSNRIQITCEYLRPGFFFSPPLSIQMLDENAHAVATLVPQMKAIEVLPFLDADNQTKPIEDHLMIQQWHQIRVRQIAMLALIGLTIIAILIIVLMRYLKHRQTALPQHLVADLKPIEKFLLEVEQLVNVLPVSIEDYKTYHDHLSNALRQYITSRTDIDAMSCTTAQLCQKMKAGDFSTETCENLMHILGESDRVKFAYEAPGQGANMMLLRDTTNLANLIEAQMQSKETIQDALNSANHNEPQTTANSDGPANAASEPQISFDIERSDTRPETIPSPNQPDGMDEKTN